VTTPVPADQLGTFAATVSARDVAGNTGSATCAYTVVKATPTLTTQTANSIPLGGHVADSATLTGGYRPTGTVTFSLFGPDDPQCRAALTTSVATVSGNAAASVPVQATAAGTYNWVAVYSGDVDNNAVSTTCGQEPLVVTPQRLTGRAFGISLSGRLLGKAVTPVRPTPDTGAVDTTVSATVAPHCTAQIAGLTGVQAVCAGVTTDASFPAGSTAHASVAAAVIALGSLPVITIRGLQAVSTTTCAGSSGSVTIGYLKVGTKVVIGTATVIRPNTTLVVGSVKLTLNAQSAVSTPDHGLTVAALRVSINQTGSTSISAVLASAESDIGNCP
jgi:hypothetical protein